jgi:hypothetical protein
MYFYEESCPSGDVCRTLSTTYLCTIDLDVYMGHCRQIVDKSSAGCLWCEPHRYPDWQWNEGTVKDLGETGQIPVDLPCPSHPVSLSLPITTEDLQMGMVVGG